MINIYHMFNIILPKPCEIFTKILLKICQKFGKYFTRFTTNTILAHSDRMVYFRENLIITLFSELSFWNAISCLSWGTSEFTPTCYMQLYPIMYWCFLLLWCVLTTEDSTCGATFSSKDVGKAVPSSNCYCAASTRVEGSQVRTCTNPLVLYVVNLQWNL